MFKLVITWSFTSFIVTVYAVIYDKTHLRNMPQTRNVLSQIGPDDALPVVLILEDTVEPPAQKLSTPDDIIQAEIENGRMVGGTIFSLNGLQKQLFFCPEENAQEQCLAPKNFKHLQLLQCDVQPTPDVLEDSEPTTCRCGIDDTGIYHMVHFRLCPAKVEYRYTSMFLGIYEFCYNRQIEKVLFTVHTILSPRLVQEGLLLLLRERELSYPYVYDPRYPIANYNAKFWGSYSSVVSLYTNYKIQYLVPKEDMPFGIWKTTINQSYNVELQHNLVLPLWNEINNKVRAEALSWYNWNNSYKLLVKTGVFQINVDIPVSENQIFNRWVKMVIVKRNKTEISGIVIMMNNFINDQNEIGDNVLTLLNDEMKQLCPRNLCTNFFQRRVENSGGWVQCCKVTPKFNKFFGLQETLEILRIRNLTI